MGLLRITAEVHDLNVIIYSKSAQINELEDKITTLMVENKNLSEQLSDNLQAKGLFKYYIAITHERFKALFFFLHPENFSHEYENGRTDIKKLSNEDCLHLTLVRVRHNFGLKDLAMIFEITGQSVVRIFNA